MASDEQSVPPEQSEELLSKLSLNDDDDMDAIPGIKFVNYRDESQLEYVMRLVGRDLSEPYSMSEDDPDGEPIGCVVCKVDEVEGELTSEGPFEVPKPSLSGYMAMLAVNTSHRRSGIGSALVERVVRRMRKRGCSSVTLETEVSNMAAMRLYEEKLGFIREELLVRYYLNWGDAYRLRLWFD
eukprot:scaffold98886_cov52-Attheya_sp.AAC.1